MIVLILIGIIFIVILLFTSPRLSPIPYFPSNKADLPLIIKALNLKSGQTVVDLGAGDGIVIFEAARQAQRKNLNTQFVAVELNPILILILHLRRLFYMNKKNIKIVRADMFKLNYGKFLEIRSPPAGRTGLKLVIYMYISPWHMQKVIRNWKLEIRNFRVVSYFYPLPRIYNLKPGILTGKNRVFIYNKIK